MTSNLEIFNFHDLTSSSLKVFEILHFSDSYTIFSSKNNKVWYIWQEVRPFNYYRGIAGSYRFTLNSKIIKGMTEIDSWRSSFHPSFPNREIRELYQLLLKMKDRNWFMKEHLFTVLFLIWRLSDLISSCSKWNTEIGSCRSFFGSSFLNWENTGPDQLLLKIIWNICLSSASSTRFSVSKTRKYDKFGVSYKLF